MRTCTGGVCAKPIYLLSDHLGSTSLTTSASGAVTSELRYSPWGEVRHQAGTTSTGYQYTGQYSYAADFGLLYYNARWYDRQGLNMEPQFFFFLSIAAFFGVMCIALVVFGVFVYFFIIRVSRFNTTLHAELSFPPVEDFLASAALRGWDVGAFSDLSCRWKGEWYDITRLGRYEGYTRGVVKSLRDPDGPGWIAFAINSDHRKERNGLIVLTTSAQRVELEVRGQRLNPNVQVRASINGIEWGSVAVTHPICNYQSADRATKAQWTPILRPKRAYVFNKLIVYDPLYYPLMVNNRPVASLADMWIRNPQVGSQKPFPAALQSISSDLDDNKQGILLIMLGMSLYFDSLHTRRLHYDW